MTSILTNAGAIAALSTLRDLSLSMGATQAAVATGMRIDTADDDAAYWSIATTMRSDTKTISAVVDTLNLSDATVGVAYAGMSSTIQVLDELKSKLVAAHGEGVDLGKVQKEISQLQDQIVSIAASASFNEGNWLQTDVTDLNDPLQSETALIASYARESYGVSINTMQIDMAETSLFNSTGGGLMQADPTDPETNGHALLDIDIVTNPGLRTEYLAYVDVVNERVIDAAAELGALQSRLQIQADFSKELLDSLDTGVGRLVDADLNEESSRLKALQTREQLGTQTLSIANASSQALMQLFQ
ncbi:flagellin [Rhizobium sp. FY34]|uniref:flagellin N-terminal helical domain-containing protein n=1 Tax=Rhizobium sp. FY34 TaxID=2562309 RepID=UPI0010C0BB1A|nr:flagellin [Rhizobium sp. FY34]